MMVSGIRANSDLFETCRLSRSNVLNFQLFSAQPEREEIEETTFS
jgi:hypothetical protein